MDRQDGPAERSRTVRSAPEKRQGGAAYDPAAACWGRVQVRRGRPGAERDTGYEVSKGGKPKGVHCPRSERQPALQGAVKVKHCCSVNVGGYDVGDQNR